jgi:dipeptidyl aminopeptidase/acylaminoacyl peptidase
MAPHCYTKLTSGEFAPGAVRRGHILADAKMTPMSWLLILIGVAALYQIGVVAALFLAWRNPAVPPRRTPDRLGLAYEEVHFPTVRGRTLHGWWIPAAGNDPRPLVVLVHGWGRNAERMLPYMSALHRLGANLLAFDARHHGVSDRDGYASMPKFSEDIRASIDFATARRRVDSTRVAVLGLSVGGAAAIHAAAHDPRIRAVVTAGAFADPRDAMVTLGRWSWVVGPALPLAFRVGEWRIGARFAEIAPEAVIVRASARFFIVHGDADAVVPVSHASRLQAAAPNHCELWIMPGRGHSDTHLEAGFPERLASFLRTTLDWSEGRQDGAAAREPGRETDSDRVNG